MEDRTYTPAVDERHRAQYEYQNISTNEGEEDQNFCEYGAEDGAGYPIGDGQNIDAQFVAGEYAAEDDYAEYLEVRIPQRAAKSLPVSQSKYSSPYGLPRRGTILPQRTSTYYTNEVGDYRRSTLADKYNLGSYPTYFTQDYSLSNQKRESLLRTITDKEYLASIQKWRESRLRQDRLAAGSTYYTQPLPLTHDQLQDTFMKNYKMDTRKPTQTTSAPPQANRITTSPRSDSAAMRDYYYATRKRFMNRHLEKRGEGGATKDSRSEPGQPNTMVDPKHMKPQSPREKALAKSSPARSVKPSQEYAKSINYEALVKAAQRSPKVETDVEIKYKNDDFGKSNQDDTDTGGQDRNVPYATGSINGPSSSTSMSHIKEDTSDEKMMSPIKEMAKLKISARSNRSRRSNHTVMSKKYDDLLKLQKSKCTVMSVIYDGMQKCEQSKYELLPSSKYTKGDPQMLRTSKQSQTDQQTESAQDKSLTSSMDILNSEIISKMFKEFRDYHLQNISQEVKRLQYLEVLPQKITQLHSP